MDYRDLNLIGESSPHLRTKDGAGHIMGEVLIAMVLPLAFAVYNFGPRALTAALVSVAGCCAFEWLYRALLGKNNTLGDLSAAVTGVLIAFVCPVTVPYWVLLVGDFFAIVVVKQLFGGLGKNFLNPALAARAFMLSWAAEMTNWVAPGTRLPVFPVSEGTAVPGFLAPLFGSVDAVTSPTPMAFLHQGDLAGLQEAYSLPELLVGLTGGCIGEVSALMLLIGGAFLLLRKIISWCIPVSFVGTVALLTFLFPRGSGPVPWMLYNLLGGGLLLGALFMATDYVTSPITRKGQVLYGVGCGLLTVFIRYFGSYNEGVCYAILMMNLTVWLIDKNIHSRRFGASRTRKAAVRKEVQRK